MITWFDTFVVISVSAILYGPKDLPKAARAAGNAVGQLVVYLRRFRRWLLILHI